MRRSNADVYSLLSNAAYKQKFISVAFLAAKNDRHSTAIDDYVD